MRRGLRITKPASSGRHLRPTQAPRVPSASARGVTVPLPLPGIPRRASERRAACAIGRDRRLVREPQRPRRGIRRAALPLPHTVEKICVLDARLRVVEGLLDPCGFAAGARDMAAEIRELVMVGVAEVVGPDGSPSSFDDRRRLTRIIHEGPTVHDAVALRGDLDSI